MGNSVIYRPAYDAEVEYLESTGTQYIDTNITTNLNQDIKIDVGVVNLTTKRSIICGNYHNSTVDDIVSVELGSGSYSKCVRSYTHYGNSTTSDRYLNQRGLNELLEVSYEFNSNSGAINLSDGVYSYTETLTPTTSVENTYSMLLFSDYRYSSPSDIDNIIRITYFKLKLNNVLVRDFIPVRIGSVGYLYDKVSKQLFANKGTGNFILGNDVVNAVIPQQRCVILFPRYDSQVEYLESDGNSFIDTGLNASSELGILAHIQNSQDKDGWAFGGNDSVGNKELSFAPKNELNQSLWRFDSYITQLNALNSASIYELSNIQNHNVLKIGESTYTATNSTFESQNNLSLFARGSSPLKGVRIYDFKIYQNSTLVRDFIPVRIGQVGYMYDKVSKRLFENKGSGNFILGSDTNDAVASQRSVGFERVYEEYDWLVGDGSAYINTLITSYSGIIKVGFKSPESVLCAIFGREALKSDYTDRLVLLRYHNNGQNVSDLYGIRTSGGYWLPTDLNDEEITIDLDNQIMTNKSGNSVQINVGVNVTGSSVILFGKGYGESTATAIAPSDVAIKKFSVSNQIDLIPCKLLQSIPAALDGNGIARQAGECGMWDKVSNRFYGNVANSGSFTVSND